jgi:hypothetical protein
VSAVEQPVEPAAEAQPEASGGVALPPTIIAMVVSVPLLAVRHLAIAAIAVTVVIAALAAVAIVVIVVIVIVIAWIIGVAIILAGRRRR